MSADVKARLQYNGIGRLHAGRLRAEPEKSDGVKGPERDRKHRVRVQNSQQALRELKAELLDKARSREPEWFAQKFWSVPFEPYAPVRKQLLGLLRQVNSARKAVGPETISPEVIRYQQRQ